MSQPLGNTAQTRHEALRKGRKQTGRVPTDPPGQGLKRLAYGIRTTPPATDEVALSSAMAS
jgi:hypothetical protein